MQLLQAKCTICGASLKVSTDNQLVTCSYCKSQVIVKHALDLEKVEVDKSKDIVKHRTNLAKYVKNNSLDEILRSANKIKDIIPDDFLASYYAAYVLQLKGEPNYIYEFYSNILEHTYDDVKQVVEHLIKRSDLRDKQRIISFLEKVAPSAAQSYLDEYETRQSEEDNYADIPRDVFICYSSKNLSVAKKVVERLEKDGNTCWVAYRNLRPEDAENYWENIKRAIDKSAIFLVISDLEAMRSKDVQSEISYAQEKVNRKVEFKIDQENHTQLFKHIFDGIKWVDGYTNMKKGLETLTQRIFEEKEIIKDLISKRQWKGYVQPSYKVLSPKSQKQTLIIASLGIAIALLIGVSVASSRNNLTSQADTLAPSIQLVGSPNITLNQGDIYNEPGAIVSDNVDIGLDSIISGSVNTSVPGTYTIRYNATDNAGNRAAEKTRTVTIRPSNVDSVKPVIRLNGDSTITLEVKSSFTDPLATVSDNKDINVNLITSGVVNTGVVGTYTLRYNAIDNAGNRADEVVRTVRVVDTTRPTVSLIGSSTVRIRVGETYTEPGMNVSDNYDDTSRIEQTISGGVNISSIGTYTLTYTAKDSSGNTSTPVTRQVIVETNSFDASSFTNTTTFVTLEINPSIGLTLNNNDQVLEVYGINNDGTNVIAGLNIKGQTFNNALTSLIQSANTKGYVSSTDAILIGIESNNESKRNTLETSARGIISTQASNLGKTIATQVEKTALDVTKAVSIVSGLTPSNAKIKLINDVSTSTNTSYNSNATLNIKQLLDRKNTQSNPTTPSTPTEPNITTTYSITYNLNSGTNPSGAVTSFNATQLPLTLPAPTRTGFNFQGWYESSSFTGNPITQIPASTTSNKAYFARWSNTDYLISYVLNDGTLPTNVLTSFNSTNLPYTLPIPTRVGYTFGGWFENSNLSSITVTSVPTNTTTNKSYHAKWIKNERIIANNIVNYSIGSDHLIYSTSNNDVFAMGSNINGSLGVVSSNQTELHPVLIDLNLNSNVKKIIAGNYRSFLLTESGELYAWGNNYQGMLGLGEIMIIQKPKKINERMKLGIGETIIDISSSYFHTIILTNFGKIYTFGRNNAAQIGLGIIDQEFYDLTLLNIDFKLVVNESITNVYTTSDSTAVLTSNGRVIVWGRSVFNYNIINYSAQDITNLFGLERDEKITKMFDGSYNLAAISNSGKTWIWGQTYPGMIGNVKDSHSTPQLIQLSLINGEIIEEVSFGSQFTTLRTNLGNVYTSGINTSGQLGNGEKDQYFSYYGFRKINLEKITAVFSRNTLTLALDRSGILHFWGSDDHNNYYFSTVSFLPLRIN